MGGSAVGGDGAGGDESGAQGAVDRLRPSDFIHCAGMAAQLTLFTILLFVFSIAHGRSDGSPQDAGQRAVAPFLNEDPVIVDYPQDSDMLANMEKRWANKVRFGKRASWASSVRFG